MFLSEEGSGFFGAPANFGYRSSYSSTVSINTSRGFWAVLNTKGLNTLTYGLSGGAASTRFYGIKDDGTYTPTTIYDNANTGTFTINISNYDYVIGGGDSIYSRTYTIKLS